MPKKKKKKKLDDSSSTDSNPEEDESDDTDHDDDGDQSGNEEPQEESDGSIGEDDREDEQPAIQPRVGPTSKHEVDSDSDNPVPNKYDTAEQETSSDEESGGEEPIEMDTTNAKPKTTAILSSTPHTQLSSYYIAEQAIKTIDSWIKQHKDSIPAAPTTVSTNQSFFLSQRSSYHPRSVKA